MAGLVFQVCLLTCLIIVIQTTQPSASLSISSNLLQKIQTVQGFLAKASQDGKMAKQQSPSQTLKLSRNKPNTESGLTRPRSQKTSLSGNFGIDKFVAFMSNANNLMNSNSGNRRVDNFMTAFNELFNSNGLNAFNVFYTLAANFWTVVDAVANVVRVTEGRIKDKKDEIQDQNEPDPLEELKETFEDTNNNLADVSNLVKILACDPDGGAEIIPSECLTDRDIDEFLEQERSAAIVKSPVKKGQSQPKAPLQTRPQVQPQIQPQIVPQIRPQPIRPQVGPQALHQALPKVVPQNQARSTPSNNLPTVLHTRTHVQAQVQPLQNRLKTQPQIPPQIPFQVILQTRAQVPPQVRQPIQPQIQSQVQPQVRQPIQPQIQPQVRSQATQQSQAGGSLRRLQVQPQFRPVSSQGRAFLPAQQARVGHDRANPFKPFINNQQINPGSTFVTTQQSHSLVNQGRYHINSRQTSPVIKSVETNRPLRHNTVNYDNYRINRSRNLPQPSVNQWYYRNIKYPSVQTKIRR